MLKTSLMLTDVKSQPLTEMQILSTRLYAAENCGIDKEYCTMCNILSGGFQ